MASLYSAPTGTVISATGQSPEFSTAAITTVALDINVTATAGSGSLTFFFERRGYDGIWYPGWESAAVNANGTTSVFLGPGCVQTSGTGIPAGFALVLTAKARLRWVLTGTSVTCSISIEGR